ncbi:MAG: hypothetical protein P4L84_26840 [Isosphaeraceae bacterium]|nr:hypothetical protein [Isosphaeraceae bacterium]
MRRAALWPSLLVFSSLLFGCSDPNPAGMPSEPPKELPADYRDKMKNMNLPPKEIPKGGTRPAPTKPAAGK